MFEKVNPAHPDKIADRIAGAIVDMAYAIDDNPKIAVEVMVGHGHCFITIESSVVIDDEEIKKAVNRIVGRSVFIYIIQAKQDKLLAKNQEGKIRCGDNGIFKGVPMTQENNVLAEIAGELYKKFDSDGKYIMDGDDLIICQSNATNEELEKLFPDAKINPLGAWTGGIDVDTGATNRKLGSDMGDSVSGGGINGKDCSKADVSVNLYIWLKAQMTGKPQECYCAIGDETVDGHPYEDIVAFAKKIIMDLGGFEAFAEWGFIRPRNCRKIN